MNTPKPKPKPKRVRKTHLWNDNIDSDRTACGRRVTAETVVEERGVEAATCSTCRTMYDFGRLCR